MYVYVHVYGNIHTYIHIYIYMYTHVHVHIHIHTYKHTYIHIQASATCDAHWVLCDTHRDHLDSVTHEPLTFYRYFRRVTNVCACVRTCVYLLHWHFSGRGIRFRTFCAHVCVLHGRLGCVYVNA